MVLASVRPRAIGAWALAALLALSVSACGGQGDTAGPATTSSGDRGSGGAGGAGGAASSVSAGGSGGRGGAGGSLDALPCEVDGRKGFCIDVGDCTGMYAPTANHCPGAANIQCCTELPAGVCDPLAMLNPNQGLIEKAGDTGCLPGMLAVEGFCIDRYEASLVLSSGGKAFSPFFNPGVEDVRAVSIQGAVPQGYIDQIQAASACLASGKRLCTDDEWLRACGGPQYTTYPYGDTLDPGVCNDARDVHPAVELFGTTDPEIFSHLDNACLNQLPGSLDPTGSHPGCKTAEGAFDMMGNLHEWTADPAGTFRGGFYVDTAKNGPGCLYATKAHNVSHWDYSTGFRCCADLL